MNAIVHVENVAVAAKIETPEVTVESVPSPIEWKDSTWTGNVMTRRIGSVPNGPNSPWYAV